MFFFVDVFFIFLWCCVSVSNTVAVFVIIDSIAVIISSLSE